MAILHRTLDENVAYPPHEPRSASPTYVKTHKHLVFTLDAPCWICGIRHSTGGAMETHHAHFEWASQNGLDLAKVTVDWPSLTDRAALAEWVDGELNMLVLCLPGDEPVLMADGTERRLDRVHVGDYVLGHDLVAHRVTDTMSRRVDEEIVVLDGRRMTANHLVLTPDGWLAAGLLSTGDIVLHVGMCESEMLGLRGVEGQVLNPIVELASGAMMDNLTSGESSAEMLFHNPNVLHDVALDAILPHEAPPVARLGLGANEHAIGITLARQCIEGSETAGVGTVDGSRGSRLESDAADWANPRLVDKMSLSASDSGTLARAGGVLVCDARRDKELTVADKACANHSTFGASARWGPVNDVQRLGFRGSVHDIGVACCHSFVTAGLVVHNCASHHRSKYEGIHEITYPAWLLQRYQGDEWTFIQQQLGTTGPQAKVPLLKGKK